MFLESTLALGVIQAPLHGFALRAGVQSQHLGQGGQPWGTPRASLVLGLSAVVLSLEQALHPRTALLTHLGGPPLHQRCSGSEAVPDAVKIRLCPHQRRQVPGVLTPFLWDSAVHESVNFLSKCWRERWQVNFEFVGSCVKHGLRSRKGLAGPHGKTGKRADITDLVLAIRIETGRGRGDQAQLFCIRDSASLC